MKILPQAAIAAAVFVCPSVASAQQATFLPSATQPSTGVVSWRQLVEFKAFDGFDDTSAITQLSVGLTSEIALGLNVPVRYRDDNLGDVLGLGDPKLSLKTRIYRNDFGPIDTSRVALITGVSLPAGDDEYTSGSFDPTIGLAWTYIEGRNGFGAAGSWRFNFGDDDERRFIRRFGNGPDDAGQFAGNYVFRLTPATFGKGSSDGAWYFTAETGVEYETSGNAMLWLAPGILFEGRDAGFELAAHVPVASDVTNRSEEQWAVVAGFRLLF
jgi:hypothetical protein